MKNNAPTTAQLDDEYFFDPTDDLDGSEVTYVNGNHADKTEQHKDDASEQHMDDAPAQHKSDSEPGEAYEPEDFIWSRFYGVEPLSAKLAGVKAPGSDETNNNPWISAGVIIFCVAFCALMFRLFF